MWARGLSLPAALSRRQVQPPPAPVGTLPYTGEGPLRRSPGSALFSRSSALMLLVFDHWNKEKDDFRVSCYHRCPRGKLLSSAQDESHTTIFPKCTPCSVLGPTLEISVQGQNPHVFGERQVP